MYSSIDSEHGQCLKLELKIFFMDLEALKKL